MREFRLYLPAWLHLTVTADTAEEAAQQAASFRDGHRGGLAVCPHSQDFQPILYLSPADPPALIGGDRPAFTTRGDF